MQDKDSLKEIYKNMVTRAKSLGLRVFPGTLILREKTSSQVIWDYANDDWVSFMEIAKEEGARTIVIDAETGEDEHANDIAGLTVAWMKGGVAYLFTRQADWSIEAIKTEGKEAGVPFHLARSEEDIPKSSLKEMQEKSENELAEEILDFLSKEFGDARSASYRYVHLFWERKGIHTYFLRPDYRLKVEKAEAIVKQKLLQESLNKKKREMDKEKEQLPELAEKCLDWAKKNDLSKVTKANIIQFLGESAIEISKESQNTLYSQINIKLRKR